MKDFNLVRPDNPKRIAVVISNAAVSSTTGWPVGFWWSELTHPYFHFTEAGYEVEVFSPDGGACVADAMSDPEDASQWQTEDVISRGYKHDPAFVALVESTGKVADIDRARFDALVVAGGQGPMFSFEHAHPLHRVFVEFFESGKITAALCHGTSVLRFARLSSGAPLVSGRTVTGFANCEEDEADEAARVSAALAHGTHIHALANRGRAQRPRGQPLYMREPGRGLRSRRQPHHRAAELQRI